MKFSRRRFLEGVSAAAISALLPQISEAGLHGHGTGSFFNGGKSQGQPNDALYSFAFIDLMKEATGWLGTTTSNNNALISPAWLDSNGYPLASVFPTQTGSSGVFMNVNPPNSGSYPATISNPLVLVWTGANAATKVNIGNRAITLISGYSNDVFSTLDPVSGLYKGRIEFFPTYDSNGKASFQAQVVTMNSGATLTQFAVYFLNDEADFLASKVFRGQFISLMKTLNWGVFRFMDWFQTNQTNVSTWATRRSLNYPTYASDEFRAALFPGDIMTNTGNDYAITFGSGGPTDKQTMHVLFNAAATLVQNNEAAHGGTLSLTLPGGGSAVTFNWTAHGLSNNDPVSVGTGNVGGIPIQGFFGSKNLFVVNATTNTFQVSATFGGSALGSTSTSTNGNMFVTRMQTLNLNGAGAITIRDTAGNPLLSSGSVPARAVGAILLYGTLVYDAQLNSWLMRGANTNNDSAGIQSTMPPELMVSLCAQLGAHPHFSIPYMALDAPTDFVSSLAAYVKSNGPSWMIPRFEQGNEIWNTTTAISQFATNKAFVYWGTVFDTQNWGGMVLSTMGQSLANVYGLGNLGSTYEVMCGVRTDDFGAPLSGTDPDNNLLTASNFVSIGPSISGYSNVAGNTYTSAMLPATYVSPGMAGTIADLQTAWAYYVTNVGNPTAQAANLNALVDTLNSGVSGTAVLTIASPGVVNWPSHGRSLNDPIRFSTTGALPTGLARGTTYFVSNVIDADHFSVTNSLGGASIAFTGTQSGTQFVSYNFGNNFYFSVRYINTLTFGQTYGVNKMFAYEGGYSADNFNSILTGITQAYTSPITGATNASQCVLTLATTSCPSQSNGLTAEGNPAIAGMVLNIRGAAGMTQLNCVDSDTLGNVTFTSGSANITWASNILIAGQCVQFQTPSGSQSLPSNISANTTYFVVSSGNPFQISATKGGTAIVASGNGSDSCYSGWPVASVSGNSVTIDVNSNAFGAWTSGGSAAYLGSGAMIYNFHRQALQSATDLPAQLLSNYNNFTAAGGLFPSQYGIVTGNSIWGIVASDIWQTPNEQGNMIAAYNH